MVAGSLSTSQSGIWEHVDSLPQKSTAWENHAEAIFTEVQLPSHGDDNLGSDVDVFIPRVEDLPPSHELLQYYRRRMDSFDSERVEYLGKLERCRVSQEEQHKTQWELCQQMEKVKAMQREISDAKVYLYDERKYGLSLFAENDRLKIQEQRDRKKIYRLLSLLTAQGGGNGKHEISYFHDHPPALIVDRVAAASIAAETASSKSGNKKSGGKMKMLQKQKQDASHSQLKEIDFDDDTTPPSSPRGSGQRDEEFYNGRGPGGHKPPKVIPRVGDRLTPLSAESDTVAELAKADRETLLLTIESLRTQLTETRKVVDEQIARLMEDRTRRSEEYNVLHTRDQDKINELTQQVQKTQGLLFDSTKEYLELAHVHKLRERELLEELEHHQKGYERVVKEKALIQSMAQTEIQTHAKRVDMRSERTINQYRNQALRLNDQLTTIKSEHSTAIENAEITSSSLRNQLTTLQNKHKRLGSRRAHEIEGYTNDVQLLRKRLKELEKQLHTVVMSVATDKNRDMEMLSNVKVTANRSQHMSSELQHLKTKIYSMERDIHRLPISNSSFSSGVDDNSSRRKCYK